MKKICFLLILVFLSSCKEERSSRAMQDRPATTVENFDWLVGNWQRTNEQEGNETYENWTKVNELEYKGVGFTLREQDTIWQENIGLIRTEGTWNFEVTGKGESQPTIFKLTDIEENRFVSENPANEFPKIISYSGNGKKLSALISAGDTEIPFEFERVQ